MTGDEQVLCLNLRRKQRLAQQFYRNRPVDKFIADVVVAGTGLIITTGGS